MCVCGGGGGGGTFYVLVTIGMVSTCFSLCLRSLTLADLDFPSYSPLSPPSAACCQMLRVISKV